MGTTTGSEPRLLRTPRLGGGDIGVCLTKIHLDRFTPTVVVEDPIRDRLIAKGRAYETAVLDALIDRHGSVVCQSVDDVPSDGSTPIVIEWTTRADDAHRITLAAMAAGADLIMGGRLGGREEQLVGAPDLLVRFTDGYAAVDIKNHLVIGDKGTDARAEDLFALGGDGGKPVVFRSSRRRDLLQVAHYWRLLDAAGYAAQRPVGGIIGSDDPSVCLWVHLDDGKPTLLEALDAYLTEAQAVVSSGLEHPETPLVGEWWRGECKRCDWQERCFALLTAADDPTLLNGISVFDREELAVDGITTITDVAGLAPDDDRVQNAEVITQARARISGRLLRRGESPAVDSLPSASREVDFDIETYKGQIYLAGFLVTEDGASRYEPIVDWTGSPNGESFLIRKLFDRLVDYADDDTVLFHWTAYEERTLTEAGDRHGATIDGFPSVSEWFSSHAVDLWDWTRSNLVSPKGYGLKVVAPLCGFEWRDEDPGGLQSEIWFEELQAGDESMKDRILAYNEDDVIAQRQVRRYVRTTDMPSVLEWPPS
jgi:predicted RecB family nuclease